MSGPMDNALLVLNAGSSSLKFAVYQADAAGSLQAVYRGVVEEIGGNGRLRIFQAPDASGQSDQAVAVADHPQALQRLLDALETRHPGLQFSAAGHRVVHGGADYSHPVRVDENVLSDLDKLIPLSPLHQPHNLAAIRALAAMRPQLPQVACFDTAFHHTLPKVEQMLPLPYAAWERGLRRYGFHGLSYDYLSIALPERHGDIARGHVIAAHLGSGASLCAMVGLRSVATTMGFSALDGLMMGTRTGAIDPGAVLYLMEIEKLSLEQVGRVLYQESGLLGVSGLSSEPRVLLAHEERDDDIGERVRAALALYVRRIVREIGALVAVLGGLDLLVFTAGVGEHSAPIRERICRELGFLGVVLDAAANASDTVLISSAESRIAVGVEPTNEEWIAARQAAALLQSPKRLHEIH